MHRPDWRNPSEALRWALKHKHVKDTETAKLLFDNIVAKTAAGKLTMKNRHLVYDIFFQTVSALRATTSQ